MHLVCFAIKASKRWSENNNNNNADRRRAKQNGRVCVRDACQFLHTNHVGMLSNVHTWLLESIWMRAPTLLNRDNLCGIDLSSRRAFHIRDNKVHHTTFRYCVCKWFRVSVPTFCSNDRCTSTLIYATLCFFSFYCFFYCCMCNDLHSFCSMLV